MGERIIQPLRSAVQWGFLLFCGYLGVQLARFVVACQGGGVPEFSRPAGVDAFLPIAGLVGVRDWWHSGSLNQVHPAATILLLAAVGVALLLRRAFCSWICPVGTIEELLWKCGFRLWRRNWRLPVWLDLPLRGVKYLLLAFFCWSVFVAMAPAQVEEFIRSDYFLIADVRLLAFFRQPSATTLVVLGVLALFSLPVRNVFCRFLCPYGALLGLAALLSPLKVTRNDRVCVHCGVCSQVCPAYLPVMQLQRVRSAECIGCWRCLSHCRAAGALRMALPGGRWWVNGVLFAVLVLVLYCSGSLLGRLSGYWGGTVPVAAYQRLLGR